MKGELKWENLLLGFVIILIMFLVFLIMFTYTGNDAESSKNIMNDLLCIWC
ncbi:MAG: hypothetical protein KJ697_04250 [Nanoarchaeota archaeon]|nr:hypothetical protein [Nanoarchaeota archaeon]